MVGQIIGEPWSGERADDEAEPRVLQRVQIGGREHAGRRPRPCRHASGALGRPAGPGPGWWSALFPEQVHPAGIRRVDQKPDLHLRGRPGCLCLAPPAQVVPARSQAQRWRGRQAMISAAAPFIRPSNARQAPTADRGNPAADCAFRVAACPRAVAATPISSSTRTVSALLVGSMILAVNRNAANVHRPAPQSQTGRRRSGPATTPAPGCHDPSPPLYPRPGSRPRSSLPTGGSRSRAACISS